MVRILPLGKYRKSKVIPPNRMTSQVLETFQEFLESLESPQPLQSLLVPFNNTKDIQFPPVQVYIQKEDGTFPSEPTEFEVPPYFTIQDILRLVWLQSKESEAWAPNAVFLGESLNEGAPTPQTQYRNATGLWIGLDGSVLSLPSPIAALQSGVPMPLFVTPQGARQPLTFKPRERTTLEDAFYSASGTLPTFHAYSFTYTERKFFKGEKPISALSWNGLFLPYFPRLPEGSQQLTAADRAGLLQQKQYINQKQKEYKFIQGLLETEEARPLEADKLRHFQISFPVSEEFQGLDAFFYTTTATAELPYLRYLPVSGSPMTKLYRKTVFRLPEVNDCELLKTWNDLTVPPQSNEIVYGKITIQQQKLYATLRVLEDGRADLTIQPPKGIRDLDIQRDLPIVDLLPKLEQGLDTTPFSLDSAKFAQATIHLGYKADLGAKVQSTKKGRRYEREITAQILRKRLARFSTIFQEIEPHEEDQAPSMMLRYKAVSNFDTEDRISAYLTFQASKKLLQGTGIRDDIVEEVATQFQLTLDQARDRVASWLAKKTETTVADADTKEQQVLFNPGTDIAVILQHPYYTFHIYRVESLEDYWRIQSFLSLLFTLDDEFYEDEKPVTQEVVVATAQVEAEAVQAVNAGIPEEAPAIGDSEDYTFLDLGDGLNATGTDELADDVPEDEGEPKAVPEPPKPNAKPIEAARPTGQEEEENTNMAVESDKPRVAFNFYITRLQQLDRALFDYKPKSPADSHWTTQCLASDTRQPLAMNQKEYNRMLKIYQEDIDKDEIVFIEYGGDYLSEQEKKAKKIKPKNRIYILKYGSSPDNQNYYLCAMYFCLKDYLVLIPDEFEEAGNFRGRQKGANECPFCGGKAIPHKSLKNPAPGQVVLARKPMAGSDNKFHTFVRFLKDARHPDRFELPCCFIKEPNEKERARLVALSTKKAPKRLNKPAAVDLPVAAPTEEEEEEVVATGADGTADVNYTYLATKIGQLYIQDFAKYPLQPGKVGQCNPAIDAYFTQVSEDLTTREVIKQQLKPTAEGFLRVGVTNLSTQKGMSFFAAIAPILGYNTPLDVAVFIYNRITPRIFLGLNFGNLVLEFYNLALQKPTRLARYSNPQTGELQAWANRHLQLQISSKNSAELRRFFIAYHRFRQYLVDETEPKQYRHFVHMLNEPGILTTNGISLVVLEYKNASPASDTSVVDVRCPAYGYDPERYAYTDTAFITVDQQGLWEPLIYAKRVADPTLTRSAKEGKFKFTANELLNIAPRIANVRRMEFNKTCTSAYRGIYSSQPYVDSRLLVPIMQIFRIFDSQVDKVDIVVRGAIRDAYNHLVAITVASITDVSKPARERKEIIVPIADDGYVSYLLNNRDIQVYLTWPESEILASANEVAEFYRRIGNKVLRPLSNQYTFLQFLQKDGQIVGFQLGSPELKEAPILSLPCGVATLDLGDSRIQEVPSTFEFPWIRESKFLTIETEYKEPDSQEYQGEDYVRSRRQTEELYQQFRLSFANWFATNQERASLRQQITQILESGVLFSEKMKKLDVLLGSILRSWLAPDTTPFDLKPVLLRTDCLQLGATNQETCEGSGRCKWVPDSEPRCRLHVQDEIPIRRTKSGITTLKADSVFLARLYDELLRLPALRFALLNKGVKQIQVPTRDIQVGDQYILPDNVPAYEELFQSICKSETKKGEGAKYYEEYSSNEQPDSEVYTKLGNLAPLPEAFAALLSEDARNSLALQVLGGEQPTESYLAAFGKRPFNPSSPTGFLGWELTELSRTLETPIVQFSNETGSVTIGIPGIQTTRDPVRIIIPDSPSGAAIVVAKATRSQVVPLAALEGELYSAITSPDLLPFRRPRRQVLRPPPQQTNLAAAEE